MKWNGWDKITMDLPDPDDPSKKNTVEAIAPLIISASRSTDIPAFFGRWFSGRLRAGYVKWKSPFGGCPVYVSFAKVRLFVFWSKNPAPFLPNLDMLDRRGYHYYFLFTLNDYDAEGLEPGVPSCEERILTFISLSRRIGKGRVVWRFDPLILSNQITVRDLLEKIRHIGDLIAPFCERLVFSFVEIERYRKVKRNLLRQGFSSVREFTDTEKAEFCRGLADLNKRWGLIVTACGEQRDLSYYSIGQGQCISYNLITREFGEDKELMQFLNPAGQVRLAGSLPAPDPSISLKDRGQRKNCHCIASKDIGEYSTCMHLCAYCYANMSPEGVLRRYSGYAAEAASGIFHDTKTE